MQNAKFLDRSSSFVIARRRPRPPSLGGWRKAPGGCPVYITVSFYGVGEAFRLPRDGEPVPYIRSLDKIAFRHNPQSAYAASPLERGHEAALRFLSKLHSTTNCLEIATASYEASQ